MWASAINRTVKKKSLVSLFIMACYYEALPSVLRSEVKCRKKNHPCNKEKNKNLLR